ncbi:MAG: response regulator [Ghiorsea sp.]|nr:response regulator [Ghiorsea sp.]
MTTPRLLIAEDDEALGALLEEYLASSGYDVTLVQRGDDAIASIKAQHFDIILTDIVMPGADGLHVLAESKGNPSKTLVVLMTAYSGIEDAIHAVEQGAYDFVSKPFQLPEIRVRLDNATRYQSLLRKWAALENQEHSEAFEPYIAPESSMYAPAVIKAYGVQKG